MIHRAEAIALLDRLHAAQNAFYSGRGSAGPLTALLAPDIRWTGPGSNAIAGEYRGHHDVLDYFARRRELASNSFTMHRRDILVGHGSQIAALVDGAAVIDGRQRTWSTIGLYDIGGARVRSCLLLPFDQGAFDEIWARPAG